MRQCYAEQWLLREKLLGVCKPYPDGGQDPQSGLCARIRKHIHELFVCLCSIPAYPLITTPQSAP